MIGFHGFKMFGNDIQLIEVQLGNTSVGVAIVDGFVESEGHRFVLVGAFAFQDGDNVLCSSDANAVDGMDNTSTKAAAPVFDAG